MIFLDFLARFLATIIFILSIYGLLNNNLGGEGPEALQPLRDLIKDLKEKAEKELKKLNKGGENEDVKNKEK